MAGDALSISIRPATSADSVKAASCLSALGFDVSADRLAQRIANLAADSTTATFVAVDVENEDVLGVLGVHVIPMLHWTRDIARVTVIAVRSDAQRRGIGKALMDKAEELAWSRGCERVEVVTGDRRVGAHAFYAKLHYELVAQRFVKYAPDKPAI